MKRKVTQAAAIPAGAAVALLPSVAMAHGTSGAPDAISVWFMWEFDPFALVPLAAVALLYGAGVRRVNRQHPGNPFPRKRWMYFAAGLVAVLIAVASPVATFDDDLFVAHMWQHLFLMIAAPPLLLLGMPITLLLRNVGERKRRGVMLPVLHSRIARAITFPPVTWLFFVTTLWVTHFSPIYDAAIQDIWLHRLEHVWYLGASVLFWWPVVIADPGPWRMSHPGRLLYLALAMAQNIFLAAAIYNLSDVLYASYDAGRDWGPSPLLDQQMAGASMWLGGVLFFMVVLGVLVYDWMSSEERKAARYDRQHGRSSPAVER